MKKNYWYLQLGLIIAALIVSFFILRNDRMSSNWMAPYLSGAHNLTTSGEFKINLNEVKYFNDLDNPIKEDHYSFKNNKDLIPYFNNSVGYVYLVKMSTTLFPFLGDQLAIIVLQCLFHILISISFLRLKELNNKQKWLFLLLYAVNPLVLKFVVFNFYYFWQVVPSFIFGYLLLSKTPNKKILVLFLFVLPIILVARPTIIFTLIFIVYLIYKKYNFKYGILTVVYIIGTFVLINTTTKKNLWHTVYIGIGGYENKYDIKLSDKSGYALYESKTGEKLNASIGGNMYDVKTWEKYTEIVKNESLELAKSNPFLIIKNAIVNTLQGFSIGYINKAGDTINYLIAFTGLLVILIILYSKKYMWFLMIGLSIGTFTLYYPPIQSYMYGVYLLLVLLLITNSSIVKVLNRVS